MMYRIHLISLTYIQENVTHSQEKKKKKDNPEDQFQADPMLQLANRDF